MTKLYDVTVTSSKVLQPPHFPKTLPMYSFEAMPSSRIRPRRDNQPFFYWCENELLNIGPLDATSPCINELKTFQLQRESVHLPKTYFLITFKVIWA